jgi:hypothetical protein
VTRVRCRGINEKEETLLSGCRGITEYVGDVTVGANERARNLSEEH